MEQSRGSLHAFRTQYVSSAFVMCEWLDVQFDKGALGVHAALGALAQIVEDVSQRHQTLCKATSESIGVDRDISQERGHWMRDVLDASRAEVGEGDRGQGGGEGGGSSEGGADARTLVARSECEQSECSGVALAE